MAVGHIAFDRGSQHGQLLNRGLLQLTQGIETLTDLQKIMQQMLDGDGSNVAHFPYFVAKFGFTDTTVAKACWDELNSLLGKLNTDANVSFVQAAIRQAAAKMG